MKNPFKRTDFLFMFSKDYWLQRKYLKVLHGFTYKMIEERRRLLEQNKESLQSYTEDSDDVLGKTLLRHLYNDSRLICFFNVIGKKKKLAFLDMLLLSTIDGKPLSDIDIREEVDTFLFEVSDIILLSKFLKYSSTFIVRTSIIRIDQKSHFLF